MDLGPGLEGATQMRTGRVFLFAAAALALLSPSAAVSQSGARAYAVSGQCGGFPKADIGMSPGLCMGRVWQRSAGEGPRMPRTLFRLADDDWLVADLGSWDAGRGAIWRMRVGRDGAVVWTRLLTGLSMPHTMARGPDGRLYVAEMSRIFAFDPARPDAHAAVIEGLPDNRLHDNRHPLSAFVFDADGALLVNVGAPSDRCLDARGRPNRATNGDCAERAQQAMVRRYAYLGRDAQGRGRWSREWTAYATGLRNSVAMVRHRSGAVYQGENSVDLNTPERPFDEINRLRPGADYGWPFCTDMSTALPGWTTAEARCARRQSPVSLLPPHAAPLDMLYYDGAMFPELRGRMLMSWHGHRRAAGRIVAIETDAEGAPLTDRPARYAIYPRGSMPYPADAPAPRARVLTPGWNAVRGTRPQGSPVGMAVASDGAIWVADDRAAAVLRIARE